MFCRAASSAHDLYVDLSHAVERYVHARAFGEELAGSPRERTRAVLNCASPFGVCAPGPGVLHVVQLTDVVYGERERAAGL